MILGRQGEAHCHAISDVDVNTLLPEAMHLISRQVRVLNKLVSINSKKQFLSTNVMCFDLYLWHQIAEFECKKEPAKASALRDELEEHFASIAKARGVTSRSTDVFQISEDFALNMMGMQC